MDFFYTFYIFFYKTFAQYCIQYYANYTIPCSVGFSIAEYTGLEIKTKDSCTLQETKMNRQVLGGYTIGLVDVT